jgi:hypothetical protein
MGNFLILPNLQPLTAIGANVNVLAACHYFLAKLFIVLVVPNFFVRLNLQITQPVRGIFIKTTRNYKTVPRNNVPLP